MKTGSEMLHNDKQCLGVSRQCQQAWDKPKSTHKQWALGKMKELVNATMRKCVKEV